MNQIAPSNTSISTHLHTEASLPSHSTQSDLPVLAALIFRSIVDQALDRGRPGIDLYRITRLAFLACGTTLQAECRRQAWRFSDVRDALRGRWFGPLAHALRLGVLEAAQRRFA